MKRAHLSSILSPLSVFEISLVFTLLLVVSATYAQNNIFIDDFNGPNNVALCNGWIEKTPGAFMVQATTVRKAATTTEYQDNLVYRPVSEIMLDGEASIEVRFASLPPGYPQVFVRGQMATITRAGVFDGYLLFIDNDMYRAILSRVENGNYYPLAVITLTPGVDTSGRFRLRLGVAGTDPVALKAFVERFDGTDWQVLGQAMVNDAAVTRVAMPGTVGFGGFAEGGVYTYDNFIVTVDGNPVPAITALDPVAVQVGEPGVMLTVTGNGFLPSSVVRWNGVPSPTTFVSASRLTATIPSTDLAVSGTGVVTVFTPAPGGGPSNPHSVFILQMVPGSTFVDDFNRSDSITLGNEWIVKNPDAFALLGNAVNTVATVVEYRDNLVYRPASEIMLDGEASIEVRFTSLPPGYPQVFVRSQMATIADVGGFEGYLLFIDNDPRRAILGRVQGSQFTQLAPITIAAGLNTTDTFRLRLRATGVTPVVLEAFIERLTEIGWEGLGYATISDATATRIATPGTVGFTRYVEGGLFSYDNFVRVSYDGLSLTPVLTTSGLLPNAATVGSPGFTLTVNGIGFTPDSVVRWNGSDRSTVFVSTTALRATVRVEDLAVAGTAAVTVFTSLLGGRTSNPRSFTILESGGKTFFDNFKRSASVGLGNGWIQKNPTAFVLIGEAVQKQVTATGYQDNLVYRPTDENVLDGEGSVEIRFSVLTSGYPQIFDPGYAQVFVRGQTATIATAGSFDGYLLFINGIPTHAILSRIEGGDFIPLAGIPLNPGLNITDTFRLRLRATGTTPVVLNAFIERLTATGWQVIGQATVNDEDATRIATAGTVGFTGYVEGGNYAYSNFARLSFDGGTANPLPITSGLLPSDTPVGSGGGFTVIVTGTGFVPDSVVRWNGFSRPTIFISTTALQVALTAEDLASAGLAAVTVFTSPPGGGLSNTQNFIITGGSLVPVPGIIEIVPSTAIAGEPALTLTVLGSGFTQSSVVRWNGLDKPTTLVSATQVTATIAAQDLAVAGTAAVTVHTPSPGGGTSSAQSFTIEMLNHDFLNGLFENFQRPESNMLGNGWLEKNAMAFALTGNAARKVATTTGYQDNLVYRPADKVMLDGEVRIEIRLNSLPPGYPQVFVRGQMATIATPGIMEGYLLFVNNDSGRAALGRIKGGAFSTLADIPLLPGLNTTDIFRLRLRVTGTSPVILNAFVERLTGTCWTVIGQATVSDAATTRIATAGTVGFTGYVEGGVYTYDNFTRISFDNVTLTLTWDDPNAGFQNVDGYNLYYWQPSWTFPVSVDVGPQHSYTLTDLEIGQPYYFAVTAYDLAGGRESAFSNVVRMSTMIPVHAR